MWKQIARVCLVVVAGLGIGSACGQMTYEEERQALVETLRAESRVAVEYGAPAISEETLAVIGQVPRHEFVPEPERHLAYQNHPLPIGDGQTISQPYIVALMTELAAISNDEVVLEVGTGSGYQAAVLSEVAAQVYTIEIIESLGLRATDDLERLGYDNVLVRVGDGYAGWPEQAPFDAILVTAAPEEVPQPLIDQLAVGGRMIIPVGAENRVQMLRLFIKDEEGTLTISNVIPVRFVPLTRDPD